MLKGKSIQELATEIARQNDVKQDYIADERSMTLTPVERHDEKGNPLLPSLRFGIEGVRGSNGGDSTDESFEPSNRFLGHLGNATEIPIKYVRKLQSEDPSLLCVNANRWLHAQQDKPVAHMVRTLDGGARALMSSSYRPIDHSEIAESIFTILAERKMTVKTAEITETRLYIQAVSPKLEGDAEVGDPVQGGIAIRNSEVGAGAYEIEDFLWRLICKNGMVGKSVYRKTHAGVDQGKGFEGAAQYLKDDTRRVKDAAMFMEARDTVEAWLSDDLWQTRLLAIRETTERRIEGDIPKAVEVATKRLDLSEDEGASVLRHLIEGGKLTQWGLANAVTRVAHEAQSYDRAFDLETAGAQVIELPRSDWKSIAEAAA